MEENFPRGGSLAGTKRKFPANNDTKDLFTASTSTVVPKKKKKIIDKKERLKKVYANKLRRKQQAVVRTDDILPGIVMRKHLSSGMVILGCIKQIHELELHVSLPNGHTGLVSITDISDAYTEQLKNLASGSLDMMDEDQSVSGLHDLFHVGQLVRAKILDVPEMRKHMIKLSLNPRDVNSSLTGATLKHRMVLSCCVSSVEDHGFVLDLGVTGVSAFLQKNQAEEFISGRTEGKAFNVGSHLHCMLKSGKRFSEAGEISNDALAEGSRTVAVIIDPKKLSKAALHEEMGVTSHMLLPGMVVDAQIYKITDEGICIKFLSFKGSIHRSHLTQAPKQFGVNDKIRAAVLFVHPIMKTVTLTTLEHLLAPNLHPGGPFTDLAVGDIEEEAKVWRVDKMLGVFFWLSGGQTRALAQNFNLSDSKIKDVKKSFSKGELKRCRVVDFNFADRVVHVSLKESVLSQQFLHYADIKPAMMVEGTIFHFHNTGVTVKLSNNIMGFIPNSHLSDARIKDPRKRFSEGDKIKCKVLDIKKDKGRIWLTHKKSLMYSKYPDLLSFSQVVPKLITEGYVLKILPSGLVVKFYGDMQGFVPRFELSSEPIQYIDQVFYIGQAIKCQVKLWKEEERRLILTLKIEGQASSIAEKAKVPEDFKIGKLVDCKVKSVAADGISVVLLSSKLDAFIPTMHLSDHVGNCTLLHKLYKEGEVIKDAMFYDRSAVLILTKKQSLIKAFQDDSVLTSFQDLQPGMLIPGVIKKKMTYGLFVSFGHDLTGLAANKYICDRKVAEPGDLFQIGQSVVAKVTEVDHEKKRFLVSLRMIDCYHDDLEDGLHLLQSYLEEYDAIMEKLKSQKGKNSKLSEFKTGQVITVEVHEVNKKGALCQHSNGVKGFITIDHMPGVTCEAGDELEAVVLYVDPVADCLELSLNRDLLKALHTFKDDKFSKAKVDQGIKSEVHLIKDDFILVSLKAHAKGRLAFLPAKKHLNDVLEQHQYVVGQITPVVIQRLTESHILASLKIHSEASIAAEATQGKGLIEQGAVLPAKILAVHDFQMNVKVAGKLRGRVHVSEVTTTPQVGTNPLNKYKPNQEIMVKVIGLRDVKKKKSVQYCPLTRSFNPGSMLAECSVIPEKLKDEGLKEGDAIKEIAFQPGDKVVCYVCGETPDALWVLLNPLQSARVLTVNLGSEPGVTPSDFKHGHAYTARVVSATPKKLKLTFIEKPVIIKPGSKLSGIIRHIHGSRGLTIDLGSGKTGQVALPDIADEFKDHITSKYEENQCVKCYVLRSRDEKFILSLRRSRLKKAGALVTDREIPDTNALATGDMLRGYVSNCTASGVFVALGSELTGLVPYQQASRYFIEKPADALPTGKVVTVKVLSIDHAKKHVELSMLEGDTGLPDQIPEEQRGALRDEDEVKYKQKRKRTSSVGSSAEATSKPKVLKSTPESDSGVESDNEVEDSRLTLMSPTHAPRLSLATGFSWITTLTLPGAPIRPNRDSDSEDEEKTKQKPKTRKTRQEKKEETRLEEQKLFERERLIGSGDQAPESAEEYDRLVLQSPDSSLVWLRYMAYHLETAEIEKARAVAERALKTISYREEQEKFNIWVAYLNLENMYGIDESLQAVFQKAVQHNEPVKIYNQLIQIYVKSDKIQAAEDLHQALVKRYSSNKDIWIQFGAFYFQQNKAEQARKLMQRSLKSLEQKHHVEVIAKFGQMEFKHGEPERGKTIFENVLSNYSKRTDLWSVYIDMVTKLGELDPVRQLYDRVINLKLSAKKMKFFFKKYIGFEEKYGTEESVAEVKNKAIEYVENQIGETS